MSDTRLRSALHRQLRGLGQQEPDVSAAVDLAIHAADEAIETLQRIVFSHPDGKICLQVFGIALGVLRMRGEAAGEALTDVAKKFGATVEQKSIPL